MAWNSGCKLWAAVCLAGLAGLVGCGGPNGAPKPVVADPAGTPEARRPVAHETRLDMPASSPAPTPADLRPPSAPAPAPSPEPAPAPAAEAPAVEGQGPGSGGDRFDAIVENAFVAAKAEPLSTFSIDVDTVSYSKVRSLLLDYHQLPPRDSVRIEEMVNYFPYQYIAPSETDPFAVHVDVATCPWKPEHRLMRIGLKGREIDLDRRPPSNLVFLIDCSGSMMPADRLPLIKESLKRMVGRLRKTDTVTICAYAGSAGLILPPTTGDKPGEITAALDLLKSGGSTAGGEGILLAYKMAEAQRIEGGTNRVLLCTDGDFNVGVTSTGELVRLAEGYAKKNIFLTILGVGTGNFNDALLEQLSNKANGQAAFLDSLAEGEKMLGQQLAGTLVTIAKDVKIQVEFNPAVVRAHRLVGYENRVLAHQDFANDKKDAGDIGAGHVVTALYEIVPVDSPSEVGKTGTVEGKAAAEPLKYQSGREPTPAAGNGEICTVKLRFKEPEENESKLLEKAVVDRGLKIAEAAEDFRFAAAVAEFALVLRNSAHKGGANLANVEEIARSSATYDPYGYRQEFLKLVEAARRLAPREPAK